MENIEQQQSLQDSQEQKSKKTKKQRMHQRIASALGVVVLLCGLVQIIDLFLDFKGHETSNDAQIEQYISPINLRASGYIKKVCFREHQMVHQGDTLMVLDDREYKIRVIFIYIRLI